MWHAMSSILQLMRLSPILAAACLVACAPTAEPQAKPRALQVETAAQHWSFSDAKALAEAFREGSDLGLIISAHRGGPKPGYPENCLETFAQSITYAMPVMLECDVRETSDGVLILMHDDTLDRTTTGAGKVSETSFEVVRELWLRDNQGDRTAFRVPTLKEALAWSEGRAVLALDAKRGVPFEKVVAEVQAQNAQNRCQLITYTTIDAQKVHKLGPSIHISAGADTEKEVSELLASGIPARQMSVFTGVGRIRPEVIAALKKAGIRSALGTFGEMDEQGMPAYTKAADAGIGIIATDAPWKAAPLAGK